MARQIVENLESFSEAEQEALEFLPEELEEIESELYPNLESTSLEEVAKDLEAYFEGGVEQARPDISKFDLKGSVTLKLLSQVHGPEFNNCLKQAGWREAKNAHILKRLKQRGPSVGINTLADFAREVRQGKTERGPRGVLLRVLNITMKNGKKPFVVFRDDRTPGTFITLSFS